MAKRGCFSIGALDDFLQKPVVAFVRLSDSVVMESALECPVPVRFVFVLLGPSQSGIDYSESGRAMGALMADWVRNGALAMRSHNPTKWKVAYVVWCRLVKAFCVSALTGVLFGGLLGPD